MGQCYLTKTYEKKTLFSVYLHSNFIIQIHAKKQLLNHIYFNVI